MVRVHKILIVWALGALLASLIAPLGTQHKHSVSSLLTLFSARLVMAAQTDSFSARIEKTQFNGWNAYRLTNGIISLYVTPDIGGRAIQLELGGKRLFFVNKDLAGKVLPPNRTTSNPAGPIMAATKSGRRRKAG